MVQVMLVLLFCLIVRADILVMRSGNQWHASNASNICALKANGQASLSNPETRYPIFHLGIEDVQTWPWIRATYTRWISSNQAANSIDCRILS
jgi:hypothetical protein